MKSLSLFFLLTISLSACNEWQEKKLTGKWQASQVLEDAMPLPVEVNAIGFEFLPGGHYNYTSTLNYREAGTFSVRGNLLYTLDTINEASSEKAVKIMALTKDSMELKMNEEGKERIVKLYRLK
ncbi:MAG: hypothetical protein AAB316_23555 [Bacteroidota bacterium]